MATTQHRPYVRAAARARARGRTERACVSDWARACARESEEMGARARALLTCSALRRLGFSHNEPGVEPGGEDGGGDAAGGAGGVGGGEGGDGGGDGGGDIGDLERESCIGRQLSVWASFELTAWQAGQEGSTEYDELAPVDIARALAIVLAQACGVLPGTGDSGGHDRDDE